MHTCTHICFLLRRPLLIVTAMHPVADPQKELEDKQRRLIRFENIEELMKQYKKPLLLCAFDLQSRLSNQVCLYGLR